MSSYYLLLINTMNHKNINIWATLEVRPEKKVLTHVGLVKLTPRGNTHVVKNMMQDTNYRTVVKMSIPKKGALAAYVILIEEEVTSSGREITAVQVKCLYGPTPTLNAEKVSAMSGEKAGVVMSAVMDDIKSFLTAESAEKAFAAMVEHNVLHDVEDDLLDEVEAEAISLATEEDLLQFRAEMAAKMAGVSEAEPTEPAPLQGIVSGRMSRQERADKRKALKATLV